jgi:hypothetical protein
MTTVFTTASKTRLVDYILSEEESQVTTAKAEISGSHGGEYEDNGRLGQWYQPGVSEDILGGT